MYDSSIKLLLPSGFVQAVSEQLRKCFEDFAAGTPSMTVHHNNLKKFKLRWKRVRSDDTCLVCLRRTPENNNLPCGHAVCENCPRVFGHPDQNDRWAFDIRRCFLCDMALRDVTVKVKPDTAGVNVLTIDGGGVKGIVPLLFLQILQDRMGLPIPVQDNFEISFGTSSGRWTRSTERASLTRTRRTDRPRIIYHGVAGGGLCEYFRIFCEKGIQAALGLPRTRRVPHSDLVAHSWVSRVVFGRRSVSSG